MPPRRSHRKSHNGCLQCKRRHVKCDEQRPTCGPCTKRELACHFQPNSGFENGELDPSGSLDQLRDRSHGPLPARTLELKLLHHFTFVTYKTLLPRDEAVYSWQVHVPNIALEQPFLLDGMLATSALHLAHLETGGKKSWLQTALRYQDLTLAGLNKAISTISPANCEAVALCSIFVLLLSIGIPTVCNDAEDEASRNPLAELGGVRKLLEGMEVVIMQSEAVLRNGVLKDFFLPLINKKVQEPRGFASTEEETALLNGQKLCLYVVESLDKLKAQISETDLIQKADLLKACRELQASLTPLTTSSQVEALIWPYKIHPSIFTLLERNDPLACLLLLHYGIVLDVFSYWWFTRNAGKRLVRALLPYTKEVDGSWRGWVQWCRSTVGVVG